MEYDIRYDKDDIYIYISHMLYEHIDIHWHGCIYILIYTQSSLTGTPNWTGTEYMSIWVRSWHSRLFHSRLLYWSKPATRAESVSIAKHPSTSITTHTNWALGPHKKKIQPQWDTSTCHTRVWEHSRSRRRTSEKREETDPEDITIERTYTHPPTHTHTHTRHSNENSRGDGGQRR